MRKILILGIGNLLQKDDGLGVHIVNHMQETGTPLPENVEIVDGGTAGFDLVPLMKDQDKIIIVDALKADDVPGSVYRFPAEHLADTGQTYSLHDMGVKKILDVLKIMGDDPEVEIIGIVPEDIGTLEIGISDSVKRSIPKVVDQIIDAATH
ncbi:MAG: hydrogenase maturation protease [bacterium]|nr:hydrogenase maturation protease [bacterium]